MSDAEEFVPPPPEERPRPDQPWSVAQGAAFVENHPRRCQRIITNRPGGPVRCLRLARIGSKFCKSHGSTQPTRIARRRRLNKNLKIDRLVTGRQGYLARFYSKELGPVLSEAVERFLDTPVPEQQLSLWEELAITRHTATHAVETYREACENVGKLKEARAQVEGKDDTLAEKLDVALAAAQGTLATAITLMRDACETTSKIAVQASRVEAQIASSQGMVTPAQVGLVVDQILRCAQEAFGVNSTEELRYFKDLVRNNVKMPRSGADGTNLTPDQDVQAMAATIPAPPPEDEGD